MNKISDARHEALCQSHVTRQTLRRPIRQGSPCTQTEQPNIPKPSKLRTGTRDTVESLNTGAKSQVLTGMSMSVAI